MAFLASNLVPVQAYARAKGIALSAQVASETWIAEATADAGMSSDRLMDCLATLRRWVTDLNTLKTTPGIAAYAQEQESDPTYDVAAEFTALVDTIQSAGTYLAGVLPQDANGYLLLWTMDGAGQRTPRMFTAAQMAPFVPYLQAISDAVA